MYTPTSQTIFDASVRQDKYPPGRITAGVPQSSSARPTAPNRPTHHGSETRQTEQIAGRVLPHIKAEVLRLATLNGWTASKTVATLVEQALAQNLAERFAVMLKTTIQEAIRSVLREENSRTTNLASQAFYSAEQTRILSIYVLRLLLGSDIDELPLILEDTQKQSFENMRRSLREEDRPKSQSWQS